MSSELGLNADVCTVLAVWPLREVRVAKLPTCTHGYTKGNCRSCNPELFCWIHRDPKGLRPDECCICHPELTVICCHCDRQYQRQQRLDKHLVNCGPVEVRRPGNKREEEVWQYLVCAGYKHVRHRDMYALHPMQFSDHCTVSFRGMGRAKRHATLDIVVMTANFKLIIIEVDQFQHAGKGVYTVASDAHRMLDVHESMQSSEIHGKQDTHWLRFNPDKYAVAGVEVGMPQLERRVRMVLWLESVGKTLAGQSNALVEARGSISAAYLCYDRPDARADRPTIADHVGYPDQLRHRAYCVDSDPMMFVYSGLANMQPAILLLPALPPPVAADDHRHDPGPDDMHQDEADGHKLVADARDKPQKPKAKDKRKQDADPPEDEEYAILAKYQVQHNENLTNRDAYIKLDPKNAALVASVNAYTEITRQELCCARARELNRHREKRQKAK